MKKVVIFFILISCLILSIACSGAASPTTKSDTAPAPGSASSSQSSSGNNLGTTDITRMVVRNAEISLIVKEVTQTRDKIVVLASKYEGYVVSSDLRSRGLDLAGSVAIRVPEDQFLPAIAEIRTLGVRVTAEKSTSQDVTEQYIDLQARLKNAQATEAQYVVLLNRAQQINDIIQIQSSLSQVRQTIEQLQGQIRYLENTTSTALITVNLEPESSSQPIIEDGWSFTGNLKAAARGFLQFGKVFLTIVLWVVIFIPLWGTILLIVNLRKRHINPFRLMWVRIRGRSTPK